MLVLTRRYGQQVLIGEDIVITVCALSDGRVKLGIEAPRDVQVVRPEAKSQEPRT